MVIVDYSKCEVHETEADYVEKPLGMLGSKGKTGRCMEWLTQSGLGWAEARACWATLPLSFLEPLA